MWSFGIHEYAIVEASTMALDPGGSIDERQYTTRICITIRTKYRLVPHFQLRIGKICTPCPIYDKNDKALQECGWNFAGHAYSVFFFWCPNKKKHGAVDLFCILASFRFIHFIFLSFKKKMILRIITILIWCVLLLKFLYFTDPVCNDLWIYGKNKKRTVAKSLFSKEECVRIINEGEAFAKKHSWLTDRHGAFSTTDNEVTDTWGVCNMILNKITKTMYAKFAEMYNINPNKLEVNEVFLQTQQLLIILTLIALLCLGLRKTRRTVRLRKGRSGS